MDSSKRSKAIEYLASPEHSTGGLAIIKNGYIVAEAYFGEFKMDERHRSPSVAKSFTTTLTGCGDITVAGVRNWGAPFALPPVFEPPPSLWLTQGRSSLNSRLHCCGHVCAPL